AALVHGEAEVSDVAADPEALAAGPRLLEELLELRLGHHEVARLEVPRGEGAARVLLLDLVADVARELERVPQVALAALVLPLLLVDEPAQALRAAAEGVGAAALG